MDRGWQGTDPRCIAGGFAAMIAGGTQWVKAKRSHPPSRGLTMTILLLIEVISGIAALLLTAMAFTHLSWAEGASSQAMKRESMARAKGLFALAGGLWAVCVLCYLSLR